MSVTRRSSARRANAREANAALSAFQPQISLLWTPAARQAWKAANVVEAEAGVSDEPPQQLSTRALNSMLRRATQKTLAGAPPAAALLQKYLCAEKGGGVPCEVGLTVVSDAEIHAMNRDYRGKDKPTDVLSFAQSEGEEFPFEVSGVAGAPALPLGDVVISIETALRQSREQKHSLHTELAFLAIHGTLHLMGYDHVTDAGRRVMWKWQEEIFEQCRPRG